MLFAEIADSVWIALIAAAGISIKQYFEWRIATTLALKVEAAATKIAGQVVATEKRQESKMEQINANVATIEKATNSMKDALVKATGDAKFLEGEKAGRGQGPGK